MNALTRLCAAPGCYDPAGSRGRCPRHARELAKARDPRTTTEAGRGWDHQQLAKRVLREEHVCWVCGGAPTDNDPLEADHVVPLSMGGQTVRSNVRAAHRSCNRSRGGSDRLWRRRPYRGGSNLARPEPPESSQP